ncbi:MAG TPA: hypothetical protein VMY34_07720 [Acidimicrobiales bacterium]|nr:hypothetical protein [Acidimicrobiales bacterium]
MMFDIEQYFAAVDHERSRRGLTWAALTRELNAPFSHRPDIPPISASTLTGMRNRGGLNGNIVVHTLMWLGRTPEDFTPGHPVSGAPLPSLEPGCLPRWDGEALYAAVDAKRAELGLTWAGAARDIGVFEHDGRTYPLYTPAMLRTLRSIVGFPRAMDLLAWLHQAAATFVINVKV